FRNRPAVPDWDELRRAGPMAFGRTSEEIAAITVPGIEVVLDYSPAPTLVAATSDRLARISSAFGVAPSHAPLPEPAVLLADRGRPHQGQSGGRYADQCGFRCARHRSRRGDGLGAVADAGRRTPDARPDRR